MLNADRPKGRPRMLDDDGLVRVVVAHAMGVSVQGLACQHRVTRMTVWRWLDRGRAVIRARGGLQTLPPPP